MRLISFSLLVTALAAFVNAANFADLAAQLPACDVSQGARLTMPLVLTSITAEMCTTSDTEVAMCYDKHNMSLY
jgi:hypothetical protein